MGHVTSYPVFLRQLDLSHNEISCWPSLVTINSGDPYLACYNGMLFMRAWLGVIVQRFSTLSAKLKCMPS